MSELILHSYDASPFTQRVLRMLAFKDLDWRWVETPMMPPKDDLLALTGGYRGTPVLQIGGDIYIDSMLIARVLERRYPRPSLFPTADVGLSLALVKWADTFFRAGLHIVLAMTVTAWPEAFRRDREALFPDINFATVGDDLSHARAQFRAHAGLLEQQLADGRHFLSGATPGLVDAQAHPFVWLARGALPDTAQELLAGFTHLSAWEARVSALGEGARTAIDAATAFQVARDSNPSPIDDIDPNDAQGLRAGQRVSVMPDDTKRGAVEGVITIATAYEIAIRREHPNVGEVVVHFPRLGYRVTPLGV